MLKVRFFACIRTCCSLKRDYLNRIHTENSCMYFSPHLKVAARSLEIPETKIHISETSTNTVPNTSATAASASSDLNGMAIKVTISVSCNSKIFSHFLSLSLSHQIFQDSIQVQLIFFQNACEILLERLKPYKNSNPKGTWEDWVCLEKA